MSEKNQADFFMDWERIRQTPNYLLELHGVIMFELMEDRLDAEGLGDFKTLEEYKNFVAQNKNLSKKSFEELIAAADAVYQKKGREANQEMTQAEQEKIIKLLKDRGLKDPKMDTGTNKKNKPN